MAPPITCLIPLDFQWIGVHLVFGPLVQKLLNIKFIIENSLKNLKKIVGEVGACFWYCWKSHQWSIGNIKPWVFFVFGNLITNENSNFNENEYWNLDLIS